MELKDAIAHLDDILSDDERWNDCEACKNEHIQLRNWLKELQTLRASAAANVAAVIEQKQEALCPAGRFGRQYVYGDDRVKFDAWDEILDAIDNIPTIDAEPMRHGKWLKRKTNTNEPQETFICCSHCGYPVSYHWCGDYNYCPNCGAKMDGKDDPCHKLNSL